MAAVSAAAAVDPPAVLVGQAFAHLKNDLCRGTCRSFSLPLRPQSFRVGASQVRRVLMPVHHPKTMAVVIGKNVRTYVKRPPRMMMDIVRVDRRQPNLMISQPCRKLR